MTDLACPCDTAGNAAGKDWQRRIRAPRRVQELRSDQPELLILDRAVLEDDPHSDAQHWEVFLGRVWDAPHPWPVWEFSLMMPESHAALLEELSTKLQGILGNSTFWFMRQRDLGSELDMRTPAIERRLRPLAQTEWFELVPDLGFDNVLTTQQIEWARGRGLRWADTAIAGESLIFEFEVLQKARFELYDALLDEFRRRPHHFSEFLVRPPAPLWPESQPHQPDKDPARVPPPPANDNPSPAAGHTGGTHRQPRPDEQPLNPANGLSWSRPRGWVAAAADQPTRPDELHFVVFETAGALSFFDEEGNFQAAALGSTPHDVIEADGLVPDRHEVAQHLAAWANRHLGTQTAAALIAATLTDDTTDAPPHTPPMSALNELCHALGIDPPPSPEVRAG